MSLFLIFKCFFLGVLGTLGISSFIGVLLLNFPFPDLIRIKHFIERASARYILRNPERGARVWRYAQAFLRTVGVVMIMATAGLYVWLLWVWMQDHMVIPQDQFLYYYLIALLGPLPFVVPMGIHLLKNKPKFPFLLD